MTPRQAAALFFTAGVWGGSFLFVRVLVDAGVDPLGVAATRCGLGLLALSPLFLLVRKQIPREPRVVLLLFALGFINMVIPWVLIATAGQRIPSGVSSIVNSSLPLWVAIFSTFFLKTDRLSGVQVFGLLLGFGGVMVLLGLDGFTNLGGDASVGIACVLGASISYAFGAVAIRRWLPGTPTITLTLFPLAVATLIVVPLAALTGSYEGADLGAKEWGSMIAIGAGSSGVAGLSYMWLLGQIGAVRSSVITYLVPVIAIIAGWWFLDESVGWNLVAGIVLIIGGLVLVQRVPVGRIVRFVVPSRGAPVPVND
ncbi:MAG TPA: DMT family transporter [Tepidiformaceae bacterium]|nr:DMT family transporter [Tepidiformaceae bacterium]